MKVLGQHLTVAVRLELTSTKLSKFARQLFDEFVGQVTAAASAQ